MRFKRLLALLLAAALALGLLAGCGGGESVASALLKLLDGKYPNISIEIDPDLEADLRQAISQAEAENAGDDDAVIRAALEKLVGSTVTFRNLGDGQQGDTTFDLVFYAGTDPDKAAQAAYSQWNIVFANVPDDGKYGTGLAMVETNSGIWMLVKATVEKAGRPDRPESEPDEPETQEPEKGPTEVGYEDDDYSVTWADEDNNQKLFTVKASGNLENLFDTLLKENPSETFENIIIKLTANETYTVNTSTGPLAETFKGTLQGEECATINLSGSWGLFGTIGEDGQSGGTVKDLTINVGTISGAASSFGLGAVAGTNYGTIQNCDVTGGTIENTDNLTNVGIIGGLVGHNCNTIIGCSAAATVNLKASGSAGGIAGANYSIPHNNNQATITACFSTGEVSGGMYNGGVVGRNDGTVTACYSTGDVTSSGGFTGGVAGWNNGGTVTTCYWSGNVDSNHGIGNPPSDDNAIKITSEGTEWNALVQAMNDRGYTLAGTWSNPTGLTPKN